MTGAAWWLASLLLLQDERDAVCGDLAESGEPWWRALAEVLGLAARRQWRRGLALLFATAMGLLLVRQSFWLIQLSATELWMYVGNWRMADIGNYGFWRVLAQESGQLALAGLWLMAGSLAAGATLSFAGRKTPAVIFTLALAAANLANVPREGFFFAIYSYLMLAAVILAPALLGWRVMRQRSSSPA
jgi:hypothetical protein